jgi:hypothetical protein
VPEEEDDDDEIIVQRTPKKAREKKARPASNESKEENRKRRRPSLDSGRKVKKKEAKVCGESEKEQKSEDDYSVQSMGFAAVRLFRVDGITFCKNVLHARSLR